MPDPKDWHFSCLSEVGIFSPDDASSERETQHAGLGQAMTGRDPSQQSTVAAAPGSVDEPGRAATDRRGHPRIRPDGANQLAASLASGSDVRLIDLSKGGAQFECDRRFLPNATVSLRLLSKDGQHLVTGRVVRSRIIRVASGGLGYLIGVAFNAPLQTELEGEVVPESTGTPTPSADAAGPQSVNAVPSAATAPPETDPESTALGADITAEEALAFEATIEMAPTMLTVTASVDTTSEQLHDMFNGNDW